MTTVELVDALGTATFAASGALVAGRKKLDFFGTLAVALVTAIGGGTLRDVLLGLTPVFWVQEPLPVILALSIAALTFVLMRLVEFPRRILLVLDAFGLGAFAVLGCQRALGVGAAPIVAVLMGMLSGAAGGAIRDVLTGEIPTILRAEVYATAAIIGATAYCVLIWLGWSLTACLVIGTAVTFIVRVLALRQQWQLPEARLRGQK